MLTPVKFPPPPQFAGPEWQMLNRWLIEIQAVISNAGGIDPSTVGGLTVAYAQIVANTAAIAVLQGSSAGQAGQIAALQANVIALQASVATINGQITTLNARGELLFGVGVPAAGLGKVNDWYGDPAGAAGARVFIKTAVGVWTAFPF